MLGGVRKSIKKRQTGTSAAQLLNWRVRGRTRPTVILRQVEEQELRGVAGGDGQRCFGSD